MKVFGLRPGALFRLYGWRLRRHPAQELFAGAGIAVGVALVFAVQVANTSITGSAGQIVEQITGKAKLQLVARSADGFDERLAERVARLPDVLHAAPLLRTRVAIVGSHGRQSAELIGATPRLASLGGHLTRNFGQRGFRLLGGVGVPATVAEAVGATSKRPVTLLVRGRSRRVLVAAVLDQSTVGGVASSHALLASLSLAQRVTGRPNRVSQVLVEPRPGATASVRRDLEELAGERLTVAPADEELRVLRHAAEPNHQSTELFAAISAMVGFLFAFNAMLITGAERRRFVSDLRAQGFAPRQVLTVLGFEALILGSVASVAGLVLGDLLSRAVFDEVPEYLTFAFPVGTQRVVHGSTIALAFVGGVLATLVASMRPVLDLRPRVPLDAVFREGGEPGESIGDRAALVLLAAGVVLVGAATVLVVVMPGATIGGAVALALATALMVPAAFAGTARLVDRLSRRSRHCNMLAIAVMELRGTRTRSVAVAAVGAVAVYGSVAIGGAHADLLRGLDSHTTERLSTTDLWVTNGGNDLTTDSFDRTRRTDAIASAPGIAAVRPYYSSFLDVGPRRVWVVGRDPGDRPIAPRGQVLEGDPDEASRRLRAGGWATVPDGVADDLGLEVGDRVALPAPAGDTPLRVAAVTTNLGWGPGSIVLGAPDYRRAWRTRDPAALEVDLEPGVPPPAGRRAVERVLGPESALKVQTLAEREDQYRDLARQGLTRLRQISLLLLIAAALAMASAMGAAIWQRRRRLAALKVQGFDHWQLWRGLLHETGIVLGVGCAVGAVLGLYGHLLASRWLELTTGFPASVALGAENVIAVLALVAGSAYAMTALPGYAATLVPMRASFQE